MGISTGERCKSILCPRCGSGSCVQDTTRRKTEKNTVLRRRKCLNINCKLTFYTREEVIEFKDLRKHFYVNIGHTKKPVRGPDGRYIKWEPREESLT